MKFRLFLLATLAIGCGDKADTATAAPDAAPAKSEFIPDDKLSQQFGERLMEANLVNFKAVEGSDAELVYTSFTFAPDGRWQAQGAVEIADETMECTEAGTWTMDPAESETTASMTWVLAKTNCAGRSPGEQRVRLSLLKDGSYKVDFR